MSDQFTLVLQVQGAEGLVRLEGLVKGLGTAGMTAEKQLDGAAKQTAAIEKGFASLAKQFKTSFRDLKTSVDGLSGALGNLQTQAAKPLSSGGPEKLGNDADKAKAKVQALRRELQASYEQKANGVSLATQLGTSADPFLVKRTLEQNRIQGVRLLPGDRTALASLNAQDKVVSDFEKAAAAAKRSEIAFLAQRATARKQAEAEAQARVLSIIKSGQAEMAAVVAADDAFASAVKRSAVREASFNKARATARKQAEADTQARVAATIKAGQAEMAAVVAANKAFADASERAVAREAAFNRARATARKQAEAETQARVASIIKSGQAELAAVTAANKALEVARLKVSLQDARFMSAGTSDKARLKMAQDARAQLGQGIAPELVEQRLGALALSAARGQQAFAALQQAAKAATDAAASGSVDSAMQTEKLTNRIAAATAAYNRLSAAQRLARADSARDFIAAGGTMTAAQQRFSPQAVAMAQSPAEYAVLQAAVARASRESNLHGKEIEAVDVAYRNMHTTMRGAAGALGAIWLTWGKPLLALWAGFGLVAGVKQSITQFAAFNQQLTIMGAIAGEPLESLEKISEAALKMGGSGLYGPQKLAEGLRVLTQAGLNAKTALEVLPAVTRFATVGEFDLDTSAKSLVGISSAFGVAQTAGGFGQTADIIGKGAAMSQTSVENMTSSIKVSSVVAEQFGAKLTDVTAVLVQLAKRNIDATSAGTALRNAYTELYTPSDKAKKVLASLGVSAYDSNKEMKPFIQVMGELREKLKGFNEQGQNEIFQIIFGERGGKVGSALMNDVKGLAEAMKELGGAAGFASIAALQMEDSITNRAVAAMNALKAAVIQAGAETEGPLRGLLKTLTETFQSKEFIEGLKTFMRGFATFAQFLVDHAATIGNALLVFGGLKLVGGLLGLGAGLLKAAQGALATGGALGGLAKIADTFSVATLKSTAAKQGFLGLLGTGMGTIAKFVPYLGWLVLGIQGAKAAWDEYNKSKGRALNIDAAADTGKMSLEEQTKKLLKESSDARFAAELKNRSRTTAEVQSTNPFELRIREIEAQRDKERALAPESVPKDFLTNPPTKADIDKKWAPAIEEARRNRDQYVTNMQVTNRETNATSYGLQQATTLEAGKEVFKMPEDPSKRRGKGSYNSPIGTFISSTISESKGAFEALQKAYDLHGDYIEAYRRADLIDEKQYTAAMLELASNRAAALVTDAQRMKAELPGLQAMRMLDVAKRSPMGSERYKEEMQALEAEFSAKFSEAKLRIEQAQANARKIGDLAAVASAGRQGKEDEKRLEGDRDFAVDLAGVREKLGLGNQLEELKDSLRPMTDMQRESEKQRLGVIADYQTLRQATTKKYPEDYKKKLLEIDAAEREALAKSAEIAQRRAQAMSDPLVGIQSGLVKMLGQVSNVAEQSQAAFENAFKGAEDAFVEFVKTGKFSMRDLVGSILADLARMSFQAATKPLLANILGMFGGGGSSVQAGIASGFDFAGAVGAGTFPGMHAGGIVGAAGASRAGDPAWFATANRYHNGGPILAADEVPIIARKGERMLTPEQNRAYEGGGGPTVVINQTNNVGGGVTRGEVASALQQSMRATKAQIEDSMRRGGSGFR